MFLKKIFALGFCCVSVSVFSAEDKAVASEPDKTTKTKHAQKNQTPTNVLLFILENTLQNNKDILSAQQSLMSAHEEYVKASAAFKPNISAKIGAQAGKSDSWRSITPPNSLYPGSRSRDVRELGYGVTINQNIFRGMADVAALKEVDLTIMAKWDEYEATKQKTLSDVCNLYFSMLAKKQEIAHLEALLEAREGSVNVATEMHNNGAAKYLDVSNASSKFEETKAKLERAKSEYIELKARITEVTGVAAPENIGAPEKMFNIEVTESKAMDLALKYNPSIIQARNKLAAAKAAVGKPNGKLSPSLDLTYGYNQSHDAGSNKFEGEQNNSRSHTVGLSLTIPIYSGGDSLAEKRQAIDAVAKSAVDLENVVGAMKREVTAAWSMIVATKQNIVSTLKSVEAAKLALHDTNEEYKAGVKVMTDVLLAQGNLFESEFMNIQAEKDFYLSNARLLSAIGGLTAAYLKIKDAKFDYKKDYKIAKARVIS